MKLTYPLKIGQNPIGQWIIDSNHPCSGAKTLVLGRVYLSYVHTPSRKRSHRPPWIENHRLKNAKRQGFWRCDRSQQGMLSLKVVMRRKKILPSLKLTANATENLRLEGEFPFWCCPIFRDELLDWGSVSFNEVADKSCCWKAFSFQERVFLLKTKIDGEKKSPKKAPPWN